MVVARHTGMQRAEGAKPAEDGVAPSFDIAEDSGWTVVQVTGEVDIYTAPVLREQIVDLISDGCRRLVIDMQAVTFIDSTGLGVLIGALKRLRGGNGELRVVAATQPVLRMLRVTGLHRVLATFGSAVEATCSGAPVA